MIKSTIAIALTSLALISTAKAVEAEYKPCFENKDIKVCFSDIYSTTGEGSGFSIVKDGGNIGTHFEWSRTTKNILLTEKNPDGTDSKCTSSVEIKGNTLMIQNLTTDECGIGAGSYTEEK